MDYLKLNIKHLRTVHGYSQAELGELLGCKRDNIASYERGNHPPVHILLALVNHFHISFNDLVEKDLSKFTIKELKQIEIPRIELSNILGEAHFNYETGKREEGDNKPKMPPVPPHNVDWREIQRLNEMVSSQKTTIEAQKKLIAALERLIEIKEDKGSNPDSFMSME